MTRALTLALFALCACRTGGAVIPASPATLAPLRVSVAADLPYAPARVEGRLAVTWFTRAEWRSLREDHAMGPLIEMMPRMATARATVGVAEGAVEVVLSDAPPEAAVVFAIFDTQGRFFETAFGDNVAGNGTGFAEVNARRATVHLVPQQSAPPRQERCSGPRYTLLTVDAPELRGAIGNPSERRLCARLPRSYELQPQRRYPVVYVLPGLGSTDTVVTGNFEAITDAVEREAIYVGVDTSSRAGSSYLVDSPRTGSWGLFMLDRVVATVDARLRTIAEPRARAVAGHSTGGFNAVSVAMEHPEVFSAVGASSPDALDLDAWLLGPEGRADPLWLGWMRVEDAMGGAGQMSSYGADWSPDAQTPRGFAWPVDLSSGAVVPAVWSRWRARSPITWLDDAQGIARARQLSGRIYLTCGAADEARLFAPTQRFSGALTRAGIAHVWAPTEYGHTGHRSERWLPMLRHLTSVMTPVRTPPFAGELR